MPTPPKANCPVCVLPRRTMPALASRRTAEQSTAATLSWRRRVPAVVPYAVKDLYDVKGIATTAGTRLLHDNVAAVDCFHVVEVLDGVGHALERPEVVAMLQ